MTNVDITGLSKAEVLAALFNASAAGGMGFLQAMHGPQVMDVEFAEKLVGAGNTATPDYNGLTLPGRPKLYFDYLYGRPLKLDLTDDDSFDPRGFDRNNDGDGSAQRVIDILRETKDVNPPESQEAHNTATHLNAHQAMTFANSPSVVDGDVFMLGGDDVGAVLVQSVDKELRRHQS